MNLVSVAGSLCSSLMWKHVFRAQCFQCTLLFWLNSTLNTEYKYILNTRHIHSITFYIFSAVLDVIIIFHHFLLDPCVLCWRQDFIVNCERCVWEPKMQRTFAELNWIELSCVARERKNERKKIVSVRCFEWDVRKNWKCAAYKVSKEFSLYNEMNWNESGIKYRGS